MIDLQIHSIFQEWDTDPMIPFPPVVEPDLPGAFLTKHPRDDAAPHALSLPWIIGLTKDEGTMKSAAFLNSPELMADLNANWEKAWPVMLYYDHQPKSKQREITRAIGEFYFNNQRLSAETGQNFTNVRMLLWGRGLEDVKGFFDYTEEAIMVVNNVAKCIE